MMNFDIDTSTCIVCGGSPATVDTLGLPWCEAHKNRRALMNAGALRRFPHVHARKYALAPGLLHWCLTSMYGTEECVNAVLVEAQREVAS